MATFPGAALMLERPKNLISAASAGLSPMLVGWSATDWNPRHDQPKMVATLIGRKEGGNKRTIEDTSTTQKRTSEAGEVEDAEVSPGKKRELRPLRNELFVSIDSVERLSQVTWTRLRHLSPKRSCDLYFVLFSHRRFQNPAVFSC